MTEKELKKEKDELKSALYSKIEEIHGNTELKKVATKVDELNAYLDGDDTRIENILDNMSLFFTATQKRKIQKKIDDILDNYDKFDKSGTPKYNEEKKARIKSLILEIDEICNQNFIERFKNVLGIGS